jgi:hypothetical protein
MVLLKSMVLQDSKPVHVDLSMAGLLALTSMEKNVHAMSSLFVHAAWHSEAVHFEAAGQSSKDLPEPPQVKKAFGGGRFHGTYHGTFRPVMETACSTPEGNACFALFAATARLVDSRTM